MARRTRVPVRKLIVCMRRSSTADCQSFSHSPLSEKGGMREEKERWLGGDGEQSHVGTVCVWLLLEHQSMQVDEDLPHSHHLAGAAGPAKPPPSPPPPAPLRSTRCISLFCCLALLSAKQRQACLFQSVSSDVSWNKGFREEKQ